MLNKTSIKEVPETKRKIVDAGMTLMRQRGFNATTVDDICSAAGVTKGGFFYYFKSKDEIAKAAVTYFHEQKSKSYAAAAFRKLTDPLERVFGRLDYVKESVGGNKHQTTKGCLIGVFAQELAFTHPELREICQEFFTRIAKDFAADLAEAKAKYAPQAEFDPKSLALFYVSLVQGSLMLAKTAESNNVLASNIEQFRSQLQSLFNLESSAAGKSRN